MWKKSFSRVVVSAVFALLLWSCSQQDIADDVRYFDNFVSQNRVAEIASSIGSIMTLRSINNVQRVEPIFGNGEKPLFYVVNYKEGGFVIMSADNRIYPVLAFSSSGTFPLKEKEYPSGLAIGYWM